MNDRVTSSELTAFETKQCSRCSLVLPLDRFGRKRTERDGLQKWCRTCRSEHGAALYAADAQRYRATQNARRARDPERHRARQRAYREAGREEREAARKARPPRPKGPRPLDRLIFTCRGYEDHEVAARAAKCIRTRSLTPRESERWAARLQIEVARGTYRCGPCTRGEMTITQQESKLRWVTRERIYTGTQRRRLLRDHAKELFPKFVAKADEMRPLSHTQPTDAAKENTARGQIVKLWSGRPDDRVSGRLGSDAGLPAVSVPCCYGCGTLAPHRLTQRRHGFGHRECWYTWQRSSDGRRWRADRARGIVRGPRSWEGYVALGPGRPKSDQRRAFGWAIQCYGGGVSFREVARRDSVDVKSVRQAVERIMAALPPIERVHRAYRRHIEMLLEAKGRINPSPLP